MKTVKNKILVSVCVVSFNQREYIQECLQSIADQKTNFDFEILVSDDCSSDGTQEIINEFSRTYGGNIKLFLQEKNLNPYKNLLFVHAKAVGQYVSHIDGDDYMLPGKLQSQVDHLDNNANISFAAHAVKVMDSNEILGNDKKYPTIGSLYDLLRLGTYFVHSSVMYRRELEFVQPEGIELIDYYLHIERASRGSIYLDRKPYGCYRIHSQGISTNEAYRLKREIFYEQAFDRAIALGALKVPVESARLKRRMSFAIASYLSGDILAYKKKIKLQPKDLKMSSLKHLVLHYTVSFPWFISIYMKFRQML